MGVYEGDNPLEKSPLALFIIQMLIVVIVSKALSYFFKFIKRTLPPPSPVTMTATMQDTYSTATEPSVIAEVLTGILLGPSVMGLVPGFTETIFPNSSIATFKGW
jgi:uncharacterized membrane protein YjjP (DUF1212 family)